MKFDPTKPVQTRDGRKARRADVNLENKIYPLCFIIEKQRGIEEPETYTEQGKFYSDGGFSVLDLINIPEKHVRYMSIYNKDDSSVLYKSRKQADSNAGEGRSACIRIEYEDGQFDE